jgi:hypothetical protein
MLSPEITPTKYEREEEGYSNDVVTVEYSFKGFKVGRAREYSKSVVHSDELLTYYDDIGQVYIGQGHCHVGVSMYDNTNLMVLRELVLDSLQELEDVGVVYGLEPVKRVG